MFENLDQLWRSYNPLEVALELLVIWICIYLVYRFLRGTRGAGVIKGVALLLVVLTLLIRVLGQSTDTFERLTYIYQQFLSLLAILLIVVFQPELRQAMVRLGHARFLRSSVSSQHQVIDAVCEAVEYLGKSQFGALIAIERTVRLGGLIVGGEALEAKVSERLLESIFWPSSPLHDLGVVIRGDRIIAANVQFPLAEEHVLPPHYGSRHRAAVGVTLDSDCIVVVVSEESGEVSVAEAGRLLRNLPREELKPKLHELLMAQKPVRNARRFGRFTIGAPAPPDVADAHDPPLNDAQPGDAATMPENVR